MNENLKKLAYFAYVRCGDTLWISNIRFNGIYSIDLHSGKTAFHGRFERYPYETMVLHSWAGRYRDSLFFLPQNGDSIDFFNLDTEEKESYPIEPWNRASSRIVAGMAQLGDYVYIIPKEVGLPAVKISLSDKNMNAFCGDDLQMAGKYAGTGQKVLTVHSVYARERIWFAIFDTNIIAAVEVETKKTEFYEIKQAEGLQTIEYDGFNFWIGEGTNVIRWTPECGIIDRHDQIFLDEGRKANLISDFVFYEEYVFVIPQWLGKIVRINKNTRELCTFSTEIEGYYAIHTWRDLRNAFVYENMLVVNPVGRNYELRIDMKTGKMQVQEYLAEKNTLYHKGIYYEEAEMKLDSFLKYHIRQGEERKEKSNGRGQIIYEESKRYCSSL